MRLATRVQAHPSRAHLLERLVPLLEGLGDVQVVTDPGGHRIDTWRCHRACLESMPADATHLLCVQDDALPQPGFCTRLSTAVENHPDRILLGFVPGFGRDRRLMLEARSRGQGSYDFVTGAYVPLVCVVYPRKVVGELLAFVDEKHLRVPIGGADDGLVASFVRRKRLFPLALVPCVADHDGSVESVGKRRRDGPHRRAALL